MSKEMKMKKVLWSVVPGPLVSSLARPSRLIFMLRWRRSSPCFWNVSMNLPH
jgi:hypothetical protein